MLKNEIGQQYTTVDLKLFTRVIPQTPDHRLILEAPNPTARRALLGALRNNRSKMRCLLHLSPNGKANKTLVYYKASHHQVRVEDHGDILVVSSRIDTFHTTRVEVHRTSAEVEAQINTFLARVAKNVPR
jgi:hypothetical protein